LKSISTTLKESNMPRGIPGSGPRPKITAARKKAITSKFVSAYPKEPPKDELTGVVGNALKLAGSDPDFWGESTEIDWVARVGANIKFGFEQHARSFASRPSATNFAKLEDSMYAWQFWDGSDEAKRLAITKHLMPIGVGHWDAEVRRLQLEDFNGKRG
jgi:hypothetical protein